MSSIHVANNAILGPISLNLWYVWQPLACFSCLMTIRPYCLAGNWWSRDVPQSSIKAHIYPVSLCLSAALNVSFLLSNILISYKVCMAYVSWDLWHGKISLVWGDKAESFPLLSLACDTGIQEGQTAKKKKKKRHSLEGHQRSAKTKKTNFLSTLNNKMQKGDGVVNTG